MRLWRTYCTEYSEDCSSLRSVGALPCMETALALEARTTKLAACVTTLTGGCQGIKHQNEASAKAVQGHHSFLKTAVRTPGP